MCKISGTVDFRSDKVNKKLYIGRFLGVIKSIKADVIFLSSIVIEGARTFSFSKCILKKTKTEKTKLLLTQTNTQHSKTQNTLQHYFSMTSLLLKDNPSLNDRLVLVPLLFCF